MLSRRRIFQLAGVAGASALVAACAGTKPTAHPTSTAVTITAGPTTTPPAAPAGCMPETPAGDAGQYPADGSNGPNVLNQDGVVRHDIRRSFGPYSGRAEGVSMSIELKLKDLANGCASATGMAVYVWHCDRGGNYSLYGKDLVAENYLRGVQGADELGGAFFTSTYPGCADGLWPHIRFEVFDSPGSATAGANARLTSQIALPLEACNAVYAHDKGYTDSVQRLAQLKLDSNIEVATVIGDPETGMAVTLTVGIGAPQPG